MTGQPRYASRNRVSLRRDAVNPMVDPRPLRPSRLHAIHGDDFDTATVDGAWATAGTAPTTALAPDGNSWAKVTWATANGYVYRAAPSGDFTVTACIEHAATGSMNGLLVVDSSGNGIGVSAYNSPNQFLQCLITGGAYGSAFDAGPIAGSAQYLLHPVHYQINKVGTVYKSRVSIDGKNWESYSATRTGPATATRIGFGRWFNNDFNLLTMRCDWIDVSP